MKDPEKKHPIQKLMDNTWALLVIGIIIPSLSYAAWGWIELLFVKSAPLP